MHDPLPVGVVDVLVMRPVTKGWQVLVLQRAAGTRCPGSWEMVHGKVLPGEPPEVAARRELHEETGLVPQRLLSITMHPFYLLPTQRVQLAAVFCAVVAPEAHVVVGEEHARHGWLTPSQARRRFSWPHEKRFVDEARILLATPAVHDVIEVR
ncbi:MAG: NUDIX domain-containing protein [Gemmatimonadaceae bacterium]|jgi:8-oxo-dGTP pyrophosphatase MutT (NUDIX family)